MFINQTIINCQTGSISSRSSCSDTVSMNSSQTFVSQDSMETFSLSSCQIFVSQESIPPKRPSIIMPIVPVHKKSTISSGYHSHGGNSDIHYPDDLGHNVKTNKKLSFDGSLLNPIWVTPTICTHQGGANGEICYMCKVG